jgi:hypothetical protein
MYIYYKNFNYPEQHFRRRFSIEVGFAAVYLLNVYKNIALQ